MKLAAQYLAQAANILAHQEIQNSFGSIYMGERPGDAN